MCGKEQNFSSAAESPGDHKKTERNGDVKKWRKPQSEAPKYKTRNNHRQRASGGGYLCNQDFVLQPFPWLHNPDDGCLDPVLPFFVYPVRCLLLLWNWGFLFSRHLGEEKELLEDDPLVNTDKLLPCSLVFNLTLYNLLLNLSLTEKVSLLSNSLELGSFVRTVCSFFPQNKGFSTRARSLSGMSVSWWISYLDMGKNVTCNSWWLHLWLVFVQHLSDKGNSGRGLTLKVYFSLLLKSMRMVICKVDTCSMCFRVTWALLTQVAAPFSCKFNRK